MPANLENLAVATGLEKVSFHSSPKERHLRGASSARDKGHEEGGLAYAKAGSSLRSSPGNP